MPCAPSLPGHGHNCNNDPMKPSLAALKSSGSSKVWLSRQSRDPYVKQRAQQNKLADDLSYRSRSAFKLLQLDERFRLFKKDVKTVLDLGAAPGGWSQVAANKMKNVGHVVAVDLLPMDPIAGVSFLRQDFLAPDAAERISSLLGTEDSKVDLILSDIAVNKSGNDTRDAAMSLEVCEAVMDAARTFLKRGDEVEDGGSLMYVLFIYFIFSLSDLTGVRSLKYFVNHETDVFFKSVLRPSFVTSVRAKPDASRSESSEFYFVGKGFKSIRP